MSIKNLFGKKNEENYYEEEKVLEKEKNEPSVREDPCNGETWYALSLKKKQGKIWESEHDRVDRESAQLKDGNDRSYYESNRQSSFRKAIPIYREKKNIITFVLEDTAKVRNYQKQMLRIIKKIVGDNHKSLFLFLRSGKNKKYYDLMDFETFNKDNVLDSFFSSDGTDDEKVDLVEALQYVHDFLDSQRRTFGVLEFKEKKYDVENNSIIFIGTASYDNKNNSKKEIVDLINSIRTKKSTKTIKYFCTEDKETISAAMLGFPVIGHVESDFYK